jgi:hypothetical protein
LTLSLAEWHSNGAVCSLSDTLETGSVPLRHFLKPRACAGILRRAAERGRKLPDALHRMLEAVASLEPSADPTKKATGEPEAQTEALPKAT